MKHLALSLIVLAAATPADAKPKNDAPSVQVHMDRAAKAHKAGNFQEALVELQAAYAIEPQPKLLYAIAQVYAKLDQCTEAIDYYERFLEADKSKQAVVRQAIDACKKKLAEAAVTTSEQTPPTEPPPPEQPVEPPPVEAAPPPSPPPSPSPATVTVTTQAMQSSWYSDVLGDALVLGGVGAAVGAVFMYRAAKSDVDKADASETLAAYNDFRSSADRKQIYSIVLAGSGLSLIAAGILRYTLRDNRRESPVAIVPSADGGIITWSGGF